VIGAVRFFRLAARIGGLLDIWKAQPIRRQVIVGLAVAFLPLVGALTWSGARALQEREDELRGEAKSVAATSASYLNQYLDGIDSLASALIRNPSVRALHGDECHALFVEVLKEHPLLLNIVLSAPDGEARGSGLDLPRRSELRSDGYVAAVVHTGHAVVSQLTTGPVGKPTIVSAYPVRDDVSAVVGVLGIAINLQRLQKIFASTPLPEGSVITLTDGASRVLARSLEPERFIGSIVTPTPRDIPNVPETQVLTGVDGVTRIFGNAVVDRGPWLVSVGIPRSVAAARARPLWQRNFLISAIGVTATFLIALWLAGHLHEQLNRLRAAAQRIAAGDLTPPTREMAANRELAELQDAFITMAANLRQTRDALDHQIAQERKMHEALHSLQRQVVRQERLAAVGLLVSGVAHELNNPLQAILGTAELLEQHAEIGAALLDEVAFVKTQAGRAREIIRNLSRFSSQQSGPPSPIDLRDVIAEVVQLRRRDLDASAIDLQVEGSSARRVYATFTELEQVTLNFVINAQQSIESSGRQKGRILIRLSDAGRKVRLEVLDNGPGVRPEDEPKLFQPFFTTKPVGKGTGLGLSVSYGIIESYGGSIGYRPNEWGGATFFFELPAGDSPVNTHDRSAVLHGSVPPRV
jgi:C4-dicarboxylate-specific signal transduction histidine kinase